MSGFGTPSSTPSTGAPPPVTGTVGQPLTLFGGSDGYHIPQNLPPGIANQIVNWMPTDRGLVPRLGVSAHSDSSIDLSSYSVGAAPSLVGVLFGVDGTPRPYVLAQDSKGSMDVVYYKAANQKWLTAYHAGVGSNASLSLPTDAVQIYEPVNDQNALVFCDSLNSTYLWPYDGTNFSSLTNAPVAFAAAYFDTRLVFSSVSAGGVIIPQRVQWSARGDPQTYTSPDGGAEDLVSMRGGITKLVDDSDRLVIFSEYAIWYAVNAPFPFGFTFAPLDQSIGCRYPKTVVRTPLGLIFLGHDLNVYVLPRGSAQAQPIGTSVWEYLQQNIDPTGSLPYFNYGTGQVNTTFAIYDTRYGEYQLFVMAAGNAGTTANTALCYNILTQTWSRRQFATGMAGAAMVPFELTAGGTAVQPSGPVTYLASTNSVWRQRRSMVSQAGLTLTSGDTMDGTSAFTAAALFPIGNPVPTSKLFVRNIWLDYSTGSAGSGMTIGLAWSKDFGQTYDGTSVITLPYAQYSTQTMVPVNYQATYPSLELRYSSQLSGNQLAVQRLTAQVEGLGLGWP